eukprot:scpid102175/ scgid25911/ 
MPLMVSMLAEKAAAHHNSIAALGTSKLGDSGIEAPSTRHISALSAETPTSNAHATAGKPHTGNFPITSKQQQQTKVDTKVANKKDMMFLHYHFDDHLVIF